MLFRLSAKNQSYAVLEWEMLLSITLKFGYSLANVRLFNVAQ